MSSTQNNYYSYTRPEMLDFIPTNVKKILDIGCGEGSFSCSMKNKFKAEIWGVEINSTVAEIAKKNLDKVLVGDILSVIDDIPNSYFDCIVFNDVLEHMIDPYIVLEKVKSKLSPNGVIVCSIPNVRHISVLRKLLINGQWKYEDAGILDRTHLRFFTKKSMVDMFNELNYEIIKMEGINPTKWWKFLPINILTMGQMSDARFVQFAFLVKPK